MKHSDIHKQVVDQIVNDLKPTRVVSLPFLFSMLIFIVVASLLLETTILGPRSDFSQMMGQISYSASLLCIVLLLPIAGAFTVSSVIPGRLKKGTGRNLILSMVLAIGLFLYADVFGLPFTIGHSIAHMLAEGALCLVLIMACSSPVVLASHFLLRKAMPLNPRLTLSLSLSTALLAGSAVMQTHCNIDYGLHRIIGHIIPALLILGLWITMPRDPT